MEYGIIENKDDGRRVALHINATSIGGISGKYFGSSEFFDGQKWKVAHRGPKEDYAGPVPERDWLGNPA